MRTTKLVSLVSLLAAVLAGVQVTSAPGIEIRISSSLKACFVADVAVTYHDVGAKLRALNISTIIRNRSDS